MYNNFPNDVSVASNSWKVLQIPEREAERGVQVQGMATASFLRNRYWILRHGKSIPNEKGLIVSSTVCDYDPFFFTFYSLALFSVCCLDCKKLAFYWILVLKSSF